MQNGIGPMQVCFLAGKGRLAEVLLMLFRGQANHFFHYCPEKVRLASLWSSCGRWLIWMQIEYGIEGYQTEISSTDRQNSQSRLCM
jgi:hypothetical protein